MKVALEHQDQSSRQVAWLFTDEHGDFISESSVYRIQKGFDLVESAAFRMISAKDKVPEPHQTGERTLADGFHLLQDHALGLVQLITDPG